MFAVHGVFRDTLGAAPALVGRCRRRSDRWPEVMPTTTRTSSPSCTPTTRARTSSSSRCCASAAPTRPLDVLAAAHTEAVILLAGARHCAGRLARRGRAGAGGVLEALEALRVRSDASRGGGEPGCPWPPSTSRSRSGVPLPGHGMAAFDGDKIWLILGLIRERMNDEQRAAMLATCRRRPSKCGRVRPGAPSTTWPPRCAVEVASGRVVARGGREPATPLR